MLIITNKYLYLHITNSQTQKINAMKTITTQKETCEIFGTKKTIILVNGVEVISLSPLGKNSGFDSRAKYLVHQISKEFIFWNKTARSIKDVVNYLSK